MTDDAKGRWGAGLFSTAFTALLIGQVAFILGDRLGSIALIELISAETGRFADPGSAFELSKLAVAMALPAILLWPAAGPFIDRVSRKKILVGSNLIRGCAVLAIPFIWPGLPLWTVYGIVAVLSFTAVLFLPARCAILSEMVPRASLIRANSMLSIGATLATITGFGAGGMIAQWAGWRAALFIDSAVYFGSAAVLLLVSTRFAAARPEGSVRSGYAEIIRDAFRWMGLSRGARMGVIGPPFLVSAATIAYVLGVTLIEQSSPHGTVYVGLLIALAALGMAAGCYVTGRWFRDVARIRLVMSGTILAILPLTVLGLTPNLIIIGIGLAVAGFAAGPVLVSSETVIQENLPKLRQATVFAFRDVVMKAALIAAAAAAPVLATLVGLRAALLLMLAACLGLALPNLLWRR
jgi:MFS family permease